MLIGRGPERAALAQLLDRARSGGSGALLLHGEAGAGKTALIEATLAGAEDFRVVRARGVEFESDLPYAGLSELLATLVDRRSRVPAVQSRALGAALALESEEGDAPGVPGPGDRFALAAATLSLLAIAAEEQPVLAVVDDVQWLDEASREAVLFAARRLGAEGVALLMAARDEEGALPVAPGVADVQVGPLDEADARALLREHAPDLAAPVVERLLATAAGNPLALSEIPRILDAEQRSGRAPIEDPLPAGTGIERSFKRRLEALPDATRSALLVAATDEAAGLDVLLGALRAFDLDASALEAAETAGLVVLQTGRVRFHHPLLRSAAYHLPPASERRAAHRALAAASPPDSVQRAWHLAAAALGTDPEVAEEVARAAEGARGRGAHGAAANGFARAAQLSPDLARRAALLVEAARDALLTGQPDRASAHIDQADALVTHAPELRPEVELLRGRMLLRRAAPREAHARLSEEAARLAADEPLRAALLLLEGAGAHMMTGDMHALVADARRARELVAGVAPPLETLADLLVGEALIALGRGAEGDPYLASWRDLLELSGAIAGMAEVVGMAGQCSLWLEDFERAEAILGSVVRRMREASAFGTLVYPLAAHAHIDFRLGRWAAALANAGEAVQLADDMGQLSLLAHALGSLAEVEAGLGREQDCRAHAQRSLDVSTGFGADAVSVYPRHALGLLALGLGRPDEAIEHLLPLRAVTERLDQDEPALVMWRPNLVEALARAGRREEAAAELAVLRAQAEATQRTWAHAAAERCAGLLAEDEEEMEARFASALEWHDGATLPFERARTLLALGERRRRDRRRADAREPLRQALSELERIGAAPWAARARDELRATGEVSRAREAMLTDELTAHELQVARVVGGGATNREAAASLFLSPKTIEFHLSQIYRKLGIRGRTELARLVAAETGEADVVAA